jgi:hypothetical protein
MAPPAAGSHASPTQLRLEAIRHHATALTQGVARAPQILATNAVEDGVDAGNGEARISFTKSAFL